MLLKSLVAFFVLALATCPSAMAIEDTLENRSAQADHLIESSASRAFIERAIEDVAASLPADRRALLEAMVTKHLDFEKVLRATMVKHFTPDELKALSNGSPVGRPALSKVRDYVADLMQAMQAEAVKAKAAAQKE